MSDRANLPDRHPNKCAQCKKEYHAAATTKGCPKCAPGVNVSEVEFQKPITQPPVREQVREVPEVQHEIIKIAAECARREPIAAMYELTEATHIGHRQFSRAFNLVEAAMVRLSVRLKAVADSLSAAPTQPAQPPEDLTRKCLPNGLRYKLPPLELTGHQVVQFADMVRAADSLDATWRLKELEPLSAYDKDGPCPGGVAVTTDGQPGYALLPTQPAQAEQPKAATPWPISPDVAAELERSDWTPEEALRWYAAGRHYDTVPNGDGTSSARILDNGAVASNALKSMSVEYAMHKGDVALLEPKAAQQEPVVWRWKNRLGEVVTNWIEFKHEARPAIEEQVAQAGGTIEYAYTAAPQREPMTDEQERAIHEAHCNEASDEYFNARPQLDSAANRRIFYAGHRKAWITRGD